MATFLIVCGGSGGHLTPGLAVAERLSVAGHHAILVISRKHVDARLAAVYPQFEFIAAPGVAFSWKPRKLLRFLVELAKSGLFAVRLLRQVRPRAVLAFGGYLSAPYIAGARLLGLPVALHEANRHPGRVIRWLAPFAHRIYLPEGVRLRSVDRTRQRNVGFPLRNEIRRVPRERARASLGLPIEGKLLVILGGSQGAAALNRWARQNIEALGAEGLNICCVTGGSGRAPGRVVLKGKSGATQLAVFLPFCAKMGELISSADLVIARAGAGTIAELTHCRAPAILVPYPRSADHHQVSNARYHERQGACIVLPEDALDRLFEEVRELVFNDWLLNSFRQNLSLANRGNSAEILTKDFLRFTERLQRTGRTHSLQLA